MFEIDNFYLIVLSIAIIVLIIALGFMGWMLSHQKDQIKFPSITTTCPDYWSVSEDGLYCEQPVSTNFNSGTTAQAKDTDGNSLTNIFSAYNKPGTSEWVVVPGKQTASAGKHTDNSFDSKDSAWGSGKEATCNKRKWANDNKIKWDTVTNVNYC
jgi:hypothetical protein